VAAALEALGPDAAKVSAGELSLGIVVCVMSACVIYSRRFYHETLKDPATASPLVFPETVFNAPASHLAALLGSTAINYTMVGDPAVFVQGLALAADWLGSGRVSGCLVVGAEEADWITSEAFNLFDRDVIMSEGAGAVYLRSEAPGTPAVKLVKVTDPQPYTKQVSRRQAVERVRREIVNGSTHELLCDSLHGVAAVDRAEEMVWNDWSGPRVSPRKVFGEGLMASSAWQCVAAIDALMQGTCRTAIANVVGCNEEAIAAEFAVA
jgi:3-oxoacyl-(acyl-carrier-protein) synthase